MPNTTISTFPHISISFPYPYSFNSILSLSFLISPQLPLHLFSPSKVLTFPVTSHELSIPSIFSKDLILSVEHLAYSFSSLLPQSSSSFPPSHSLTRYIYHHCNQFRFPAKTLPIFLFLFFFNCHL